MNSDSDRLIHDAAKRIIVESGIDDEACAVYKKCFLRNDRSYTLTYEGGKLRKKLKNPFSSGAKAEKIF